MSVAFRFFELAFRALTPEEQAELKRLLIKMALGLVAATGLLTWFVVVPAMNQAGAPTPPTTASDEVRPFEPGSGFNVAAYCKAAKTVTVANVPGAEVIGTRRVAKNTDLDYVEWLDNNSNTSAVRYYVDKQGKPQHETVDVEGAVSCMRAQR